MSPMLEIILSQKFDIDLCCLQGGGPGYSRLVLQACFSVIGIPSIMRSLSSLSSSSWRAIQSEARIPVSWSKRFVTL